MNVHSASLKYSAAHGICSPSSWWHVSREVNLVNSDGLADLFSEMLGVDMNWDLFRIGVGIFS